MGAQTWLITVERAVNGRTVTQQREFFGTRAEAEQELGESLRGGGTAQGRVESRPVGRPVAGAERKKRYQLMLEPATAERAREIGGGNLSAGVARAIAQHEGTTMRNTYSVYGNVEQQDTSIVSRHHSLAAAGKAYQAAHTGNLRRVLDQDGNDVTGAACDAVNAARR